MNTLNYVEGYASVCPGCGRAAAELHSLGGLCPLFQENSRSSDNTWVLVTMKSSAWAEAWVPLGPGALLNSVTLRHNAQ